MSPHASAGKRRGNNWSYSQGGQRCSCQSDLFTKVRQTTPGIVKLTPTGKSPASRWFVNIFLAKRKKDPKHKKAGVRQPATPRFLLPLLWVIIDLSISASSPPLHTSQTLAKCFPLGTDRASLTNCAYVHGVCLISANISPHRGPPERCKWLCPITSLRQFFVLFFFFWSYLSELRQRSPKNRAIPITSPPKKSNFKLRAGKREAE